MSIAHVSPQALDAEMACLGCALMSRTASEYVLQHLAAEDFYGAAHRRIYHALAHLSGKDVIPDPLTIYEALEAKGLGPGVGGLAYLNTLCETVPTAAHVEYYARTVRQRALLRQAIGFGEWLVGQALNYEGDEAEELLKDAEQRLFRLTSGAKTDAATAEPIRPLVLECLARALGELSSAPVIKTGWHQFDLQLGGGLEQDTSYMLGGRPGSGKTAAAADVVLRVAKQGVGALLFSLEMSKPKIVRRLLANEGGFAIGDYALMQVNDRLAERVVTAAGVVGDLPIYIYDVRDVTMATLRSEARRMARQHEIGFICLDYLQLVQPPPKQQADTRHWTAVSEGLKSIARELHVPVLAISQLNREVEKRNPPRPMLADFRDAGGIEAAADVAIMLYRKAYYDLQKGADFPGPDETEFIFVKNRDGATGTVRLWFERETMRFFEEEGRQGEAPPDEDWRTQ